MTSLNPCVQDIMVMNWSVFLKLAHLFIKSLSNR